MLPPLRNETNNFTTLEVPNLFLVSDVLVCNASPASDRLVQELLGRADPTARLIGAVGAAAHGRLPKDQLLRAYLDRIAAGAFDEKEKATASVPGAPGEFNVSTLTAYRQLAIQALGFAKDESALATLIEVLKDREAGLLHGDVAEALARIGSQKAVPALQEALKQEWFESRHEALAALVVLGDRSAPGLAMAWLEDDRYGHLFRELQHITGANPGNTPEAWRGWWERNKDTWKRASKEPSSPTLCSDHSS
jgi:hypothetical protein